MNGAIQNTSFSWQ